LTKNRVAGRVRIGKKEKIMQTIDSHHIAHGECLESQEAVEDKREVGGVGRDRAGGGNKALLLDEGERGI